MSSCSQHGGVAGAIRLEGFKFNLLPFGPPAGTLAARLALLAISLLATPPLLLLPILRCCPGGRGGRESRKKMVSLAEAARWALLALVLNPCLCLTLKTSSGTCGVPLQPQFLALPRCPGTNKTLGDAEKRECVHVA